MARPKGLHPSLKLAGYTPDMGIILTFILNAVLNMVLGLAVAAVLGPEQYGRFAQGFVLALMLASGLFEWLRLAATRYYGEAARKERPEVRATLTAGYLATSAVLVLGSAAVIVSGLDLGMPPALLAAAGLASIASGLFEYRAALARARFLNRAYGILVIGKNVLALSLMAGAGYYFNDAVSVLTAFCLAMVLSVVPVESMLRDQAARLRLFSPGLISGFARYGLPIVAGNVVYQMILLINRTYAAAWFGYAGSGQLSLATDLSIRLFISIGAALDVLLFQLAVRADAEKGRTAAHAQIASNMVVIAAVLLPLAVLFMANLTAFEAVFVPQRFHGEFARISLILAPGIVCLALGQFALSPVFQLAGRTGPLTLAAIISLAGDFTGLMLTPASAGLAGIAMVHAGALALGFAATAAMALRHRHCRPPLRDISVVALANLAMLAAIWPLRGFGPPLVSLALAGLAGGTVYGSILLWLNAGGLRDHALRRLNQLRAPVLSQPGAN